MKRRIGEILIELGVIDESQLHSALEHQNRFQHKIKLGSSLVAMGYLTEEKLTQVLSNYLNIPMVELNLEFIDPEVMALVDVQVAEKYQVMPFRIFEENRKKVLGLAMADPTNLEPVDVIQFNCSLNIRPYVAAPSEIEKSIQRHYHGIIVDGISYVGNDYYQNPDHPVKIISKGREITWHGEGLSTKTPEHSQPGIPPNPNPPVTQSKIKTEAPKQDQPASDDTLKQMLNLMQESNAMMRALIKKGVLSEDEISKELNKDSSDKDEE